MQISASSVFLRADTNSPDERTRERFFYLEALKSAVVDEIFMREREFLKLKLYFDSFVTLLIFRTALR